MRILHTIHSADSRGGGPIEGVRQLAIHHMRDGHEVELLTLDSPVDSGIQSFPAPCHAVGPSRGSYGYTQRLAPWLRANHQRFDAIIVNGLWQYSSYGVWSALRGTEASYFVFPHGMMDPWFQKKYPLKHLKKSLYWLLAERRVLRDAKAVIFTSEEERLASRQSFHHYRCCERVLTYGTSPPAGDPLAQRQHFFASFPHLEGKRILLFLGRVHEKKGCDLLLQALAACSLLPDQQSSKIASPIHLVIAGPDDTSYASFLKQMSARLGLIGHITWTGMLQGDLKWGAFHAADAFILPSHQENFGVAVAEALACSLPVLISDRVNIWREIHAQGAGFIEPDTLSGTTRLLSRWLGATPLEWSTMRDCAAECFHATFHIQKTARSLIEIIETLRSPRSHLPGLLGREATAI